MNHDDVVPLETAAVVHLQSLMPLGVGHSDIAVRRRIGVSVDAARNM
jgi:hypothetical protein